jgi:BirA family biotin operon repressor/biotin-[acetyl-CoA-carboxylase] ligase
MKFEVFKFESVTSTNDVATNLIKEKQKEFGCVYAGIQTRGRGTYGRKWVSDKGNLFLSIFFPLKDNYPPFNEFSVINPIIISGVIKHFCKKEDIKLKFPNDIFVNRRKICGILQELITINSKKFLIIGIGINMISNFSSIYKYIIWKFQFDIFFFTKMLNYT